MCMRACAAQVRMGVRVRVRERARVHLSVRESACVGRGGCACGGGLGRGQALRHHYGLAPRHVGGGTLDAVGRHALQHALAHEPEVGDVAGLACGGIEQRCNAYLCLPKYLLLRILFSRMIEGIALQIHSCGFI